MRPDRYVALTRAALWSLTVIVVTGAAVRLTGSGLGCSDWPNCEEDALVPAASTHGWIEFGNRMFTGVVTIAVVAAVLGSMRRVPRRRDLVGLSWGLVGGVVGQIVLGALLVKTDLDPRFTMGHFLLSMVLLWNATLLHHRASRPDHVDRTDDRATRRDRLARAAVAVGGAIVLVSGTVVTGTGPHAGSDDGDVAARLPFLVREVTRVHSALALTLIAAVAWIGFEARRRHDTALQSRVGTVFVLLAAQAALGYVQYFTGVPVLLVAIHVTLASLAWIALVRLALAEPAGIGAGAAPTPAVVR